MKEGLVRGLRLLARLLEKQVKGVGLHVRAQQLLTERRPRVHEDHRASEELADHERRVEDARVQRALERWRAFIEPNDGLEAATATVPDAAALNEYEGLE